MSDSVPLDIFATLSAAVASAERNSQEKANSTDVADAAGSESEHVDLLLVGSKGAGKSTLINAFIGKDDAPKPTTALEYRFARRSSNNNSAGAVANIWELGGGTQLSELLKDVLRPERISRSVVAIVLDMSEPGDALKTLTYWLQALRKQVDAAVAAMISQPTGAACLEALRRRTASVWHGHTEAPSLEGAAAGRVGEQVRPLEAPIVILAHKWDCFEADFGSSDLRKLATRVLRFMAHQHGASLVCSKHKDKTSMSVVRNLLCHHVFGTPAVKTVQLEPARPIVAPAGFDSFSGIGKPPTVDGLLTNNPEDRWFAAYEATFPAKEGKREGVQDLSMVEAEQFAEECVDELRRQKHTEVEKLRREARLHAAEAAVA